MAGFVILEHDHPAGRHYDFMLEIGDVLKTWSFAEPPAAGVEQTAVLLPDHRLAYLDYEGPVSGNRGSVKRWDRGEFELLAQTDESVFVKLLGKKIHGHATLTMQPGNPTSWRSKFDLVP
jgi:hypothetical protein